MASEVYRVEIPIIVDDQSEAPFEQARERVNRLQQAAERSNRMIQKQMQSLAKLRIEPVMRIRDKLTAGVLKADRLVKMLGAEQAAPVLTAQDKVSAVVLRINQLLEALEKNKVDVLADLKGPLMDEINEARTALVALSKVQSAPVAELRGKLFAQLTRAMTVARQLDQVRAEPRADLRERVLAKAKEIGSTLRGLTSRAWNITLGIKDTALGAIRRLTSIVTSPLGLLGVGVGGAAAITGLIKAPLELAGNMEQARISFNTMLGSAEKATAFLKELQLFAAKTPFEFPQLQEASRLLLAFKWKPEDIIPTMTAIGNAAAGLGIGTEGIERIVRALGQMRTKGKVSAEEMMQLTEAGIPAYDILQKKLGLSVKQIEDIGKAGIKSEVAIKALIAGMNEQYKDMLKNQSVSLFGLRSTIKDIFNMQILYRWGEGLRQAIQPKVLRLVEWFEQNQATVERWGNLLEQTAREAGEALMRNLERAFAHVKMRYLDNPDFQRMDFAGKVNFVIDDLSNTLEAWWNGQGGEKVRKIFVKLGEIAAEAWLKTLEGMAKGAGKAFLRGNIPGGIGLLAGAWMLGGGMVLRGAWGLGKGVVSAGRAASNWSAARTAGRIAALETQNPLAAEIVKATYGVEKAAAPATKATAAAKTTAGAVGKAADAVTKIANPLSKLDAAMSKLGAVSRAVGKVALPLAIIGDIAEFATSANKVKTGAQIAGGWGGMFAGAKLGAAIGTAIAPGLGTAIGGFLGGMGGYFGGRWIGGKIGQQIASSSQPAEVAQPTPNLSLAMQPIIEAANRVSAILGSFGVYLQGQANAIIANFTQLSTQAWNVVAISTAFAANLQMQANNIIAFMNQMAQQSWNIVAISTAFAANLQMQANGVIANMGLWAGESWNVYAIATAFAANLQTVANNVVAAGNRLAGALSSAATRAASFGVPQGTAPVPHALGGVFNRPHLGLVAEAGPEAIIPLSARMRNRALALWEETGMRLGVRPYAEGGFAGPVSVAVPAMAGVTGFGAAPAVTTGPINVTLNVSTSGGQDVLQAIRANYRVIADEISDAVANGLESVFQNMTK